MTILYKRLKEIMDLQNPEQEAERKLTNTFMEVNGELVKIKRFFAGLNKIEAFKVTKNEVLKPFCLYEVKTISTWEPKSGTYQSSENPDDIVVLERLPTRQWAKSFIPENYRILGNNGVSGNLLIIFTSPRKELVVNGRNNIYFWGNKIGYVKKPNNQVFCTNPLFVQELTDWKRKGEYEQPRIV